MNFKVRIKPKYLGIKEISDQNLLKKIFKGTREIYYDDGSVKITDVIPWITSLLPPVVPDTVEISKEFSSFYYMITIMNKFATIEEVKMVKLNLSIDKDWYDLLDVSFYLHDYRKYYTNNDYIYYEYKH